MTIDRLNFSWLVDGAVAGHAAPASDDDLAYLRSQGLRALVRMEEEHRDAAGLLPGQEGQDGRGGGRRRNP